MDKHCDHNIPETKMGVGPCDIRWEVKKRNGQKNWWCRTHGLEASAPDGAAVERCSGSWFDAVTDDQQIDIDLTDGEFALWGVVPPALTIGHVPRDPGKVHVHHRAPGATKDLDRSYDIVRVHHGAVTETVTGMAAQAFSISELTNMTVVPLACPHCGEVHIDELMFATKPHVKHLCNACGRYFRDKAPSISNPLGDAHARLGLDDVVAPQAIDRPLALAAADYDGIAFWPSNRAIISTMSRPEDHGVHVHAWAVDGKLVLDETYSSITIDGIDLDRNALRLLAVQRALADGAPILSLDCSECGHSMVSPAAGWIQPATRHTCDSCGAENRTRRKSFINPLIAMLA